MTLSKKEWKSAISFLVIMGVFTAVSSPNCLNKLFYILGRTSFVLSFTLIAKILMLDRMEG